MNCISVNNVGMQYLYPMYITEVPESTVWDLVNVNVGATTHMTKLVLPGMQKRKRGAIVNVSSSAELQPMPLLAVYAATKVAIWVHLIQFYLVTSLLSSRLDFKS